MIRQAVESDFAFPADCESAIRLHALKTAYGLQTPFLRFFTDGEAVLSLMDCFAVLYAPHAMTEEFRSFLSFYSDIHTVRTDANTADAVANALGGAPRQGSVMRFDGDLPSDLPLTDAAKAEELYALLRENFSTMPPFDSWYVDFSHRLRHDIGRYAAIVRDGHPVSIALTVAETPTAVLLGGVATAPAWRHHGFASACVRTLVAGFRGEREVYIAPVDATAAALYHKIGFVPVGTWAEIDRR